MAKTQIEVITSVERRRRWSAAEKERLLEVETRGFKGPRSYDASGLPLHFDTSRYSRSESISTEPIPTSSMTRSPSSTMR